jgi:hypothetical protein
MLSLKATVFYPDNEKLSIKNFRMLALADLITKLGTQDYPLFLSPISLRKRQGYLTFVGQGKRVGKTSAKTPAVVARNPDFIGMTWQSLHSYWPGNI